MSQTSSWPLPPNGVRFVTPHTLTQSLAEHPIASQLYPNSLGYYPEAYHHTMERDDQDDYILLYCVAGLGQIQFKQHGVQTVHAGDVILIPPTMAPHKYQADSQSPWTIYWFHYTGKQAPLFTEQLTQQYESALFHYGVNSTLIKDFERLMKIKDTGYQFKNMLHTCSLVQQIMTQLLTPPSTLGNKSSHTQDFDAEPIQQHMKQHIKDALTLEELAALSSLSKYHFTREYKRITGYAPLQHFQHLKMEQACLMLDSSDLGVNQIAEELGYHDPYYFSRQFKKIIGLSPRNYRKLKV